MLYNFIHFYFLYTSLWPSGIGSRLGWTGASFEGGWGPLPPRKKKKKKEKKKKEKKKKKKERKKGTMNNVKLLHIKCCFFAIFQ